MERICPRWMSGFGCNKNCGREHLQSDDWRNECHRWQRGQSCRQPCFRLHVPHPGAKQPPQQPKPPPEPKPAPSSASSSSSHAPFKKPPPPDPYRTPNPGPYPGPPPGPPPKPPGHQSGAPTGPPPKQTAGAPPKPAPAVPPLSRGSDDLRNIVANIVRALPFDDRPQKIRKLLTTFHDDKVPDQALRDFFKPTVIWLTSQLSTTR